MHPRLYLGLYPVPRIPVRVYLSNAGPTATGAWGEFEKNPTYLARMLN